MKIRVYGTEYLVTENRGQQIKEALLSGNPPEWVLLNGDLVRASSITAIAKGGTTPGDRAMLEEMEKQDRIDSEGSSNPRVLLGKS